jgi:hypothetical protein
VADEKMRRAEIKKSRSQKPEARREKERIADCGRILPTKHAKTTNETPINNFGYRAEYGSHTDS